jgi:natural product precursor
MKNNKLSLNKETITKLNQSQMDSLRGGQNGGAEEELARKSIVACWSLIANCETKSCATIICIPVPTGD